VFEPVRTMAAAMSSRPYRARPVPRIVVVIDDLESAGGVLLAAYHLANGEVSRLSVLLSRPIAGDVEALDRLFAVLPARPGRVRTLSPISAGTLVESVHSENASILVLGATAEFMKPESLRHLRQRLKCPICLVRFWGDTA
jgi:hypothetical protein